MSTTRVVFLMSALINIAGHTCLFCAVGDMLTGKVSMGVPKMHIVQREEERFTFNIAVSEVRSYTQRGLRARVVRSKAAGGKEYAFNIDSS